MTRGPRTQIKGSKVSSAKGMATSQQLHIDACFGSNIQVQETDFVSSNVERFGLTAHL